MKRFFVVLPLFLVTVLTAGCQVPSSPQTYGSCLNIPTTSSAWVPLNPVGSLSSAPTSALAYIDRPSVGIQCYAVVAYDPNTASPTYKLYSVPSNIVQEIFTSSNTQVNLTWDASTTSGVVYVVSRASAPLISPPGAPVLKNPTVATALPLPIKQAPTYLAKVNAPKALSVR